MDVFEAMETCRAIRFFKKDPVPDALIDKILYAATRAPNPGNSQGWDFVVITDPAIKRDLSKMASNGLVGVLENMAKEAGGTDALDPVAKRMMQGTLNLLHTLGDVPAIILVCGRKVYPPQAPNEQLVWAALYAATQNILLAARALGLGTCITTYHFFCESELRKLLKIPDDVYIAAFVPVGWPAVNFGPLVRRPVKEVVHSNGW